MPERVQALSGASAMLSARHVDPVMDEGEHAHVWTVTIWWPSQPHRDGRAMRAALEGLLQPWQDTTLPADLWSGESIAERVLAVLGNGDICRVDVTRPEGFHATVSR